MVPFHASPPAVPHGCRFVCEICVLYAAEGGFELPQRTFEALVKIAHHYNHAIWPTALVGATAINSGSTAVCASLESTTMNVSGSSQSEFRAGHERKGGITDEKRGGGQQPGSPLRNATEGRNEGAITQEILQQQRITTPSSSTPPFGGDDEEGAGERPGSSAISNAGTDGSHGRLGDDGLKELGKNSKSNSRQQCSINSLCGSALETGKHALKLSSPRDQDDHGVIEDDGLEGENNKNGATANKLNIGFSGAVGGRQRQATALGARNDKVRREQTTLWTRAVGALCSPSHKDLWLPMIDAGILGALYK